MNTIRDWEWMLRTAAPEEGRSLDNPENHDDLIRDIWEGSRSGQNPAAAQWLDERAQYTPTGTIHGQEHPDWAASPTDRLPDIGGEAQHVETNRDIDGDHEAFLRALHRGGEDEPDFSPYSLAGPPTEPYNPTSEERLKSDEAWALGPGKHFDFPGGREAIENIHNGMKQRGFDLINSGSDARPIPAYVHYETGARIAPSGQEYNGHLEGGEDGWYMQHPVTGITQHAGPASAAAAHQKRMDEQAAAEQARWDQHMGFSPSSPRSSPRERAPRDISTDTHIGKSKAQRLGWSELFHHAIAGNGGNGKSFERASVKSVHDPSRWQDGRLYGVHNDQWHQDHDAASAGIGKVSQAIYHYATPIAWKYHQLDSDGNYDEGKWRVPATSFGSGGWFSTGRVQNLMAGAIHQVPHDYLRDPLVDHRVHRSMEAMGLKRQPDQSYKGVDTEGNIHTVHPSQTGRTSVHTVVTPDERSLTKRVPTNLAAGAFALAAEGPDRYGIGDYANHLKKNLKYRESRPHLSGVASWSEFLRG